MNRTLHSLVSFYRLKVSYLVGINTALKHVGKDGVLVTSLPYSQGSRF